MTKLCIFSRKLQLSWQLLWHIQQFSPHMIDYHLKMSFFSFLFNRDQKGSINQKRSIKRQMRAMYIKLLSHLGRTQKCILNLKVKRCVCPLIVHQPCLNDWAFLMTAVQCRLNHGLDRLAPWKSRRTSKLSKVTLGKNVTECQNVTGD